MQYLSYKIQIVPIVGNAHSKVCSKSVVIIGIIIIKKSNREAKMRKLYRILLILGSLIGVCATVRW